MKDSIRSVYYQHYKKLFFFPILLVVIAFIILGINFAQTGDIITKDVSLEGGTTATIQTDVSFPTLEEDLKVVFPDGDFFVRELNEFGSDTLVGVVIEASGVEVDELTPVLEEIMGLELNENNYSVEFIGSSLGESFYKQMLFAILLAFLFMAIVVFITFRVFVPSFIVVFAAFADMVCTLAILSLFHVRLSTAGIAAILLLIGYSIDTDILLTTKILKRNEGSVFERLFGAMKTGLTMTATTVIALTVGYFVSSSLVLKQMFLIIVIGLLIDVIMTYAMNAGLLVWYAKTQKRSGSS
ncbi:MAG: protein translocase subunit SecF [Nanoarchaeota archaeon]|nr:protein translocase subunit SecF [Nanoarchaeota archaeon]